MSMNNYGLIYGSSIGRILFYTFHVQQERVISEFSEECIRGAYISQENDLYIAIGDRYCLSLSSPTSDKKQVNHDFQHIDDICLSSQVLMKGSQVCIVQLSEGSTEGLIITDISKKLTRKFPLLPFKPHSVPYDFDGEKLLWMEWEGKSRNFKYFDFSVNDSKNIASFHKDFGQIGFCKLVGHIMVFVKDFRDILAFDLRTGLEVGCFGKHSSDIVAINWVKVRNKEQGMQGNNDSRENEAERVLVIAVDYRCNIKFWEFGKCVYAVNITEFTELTEEYRQELYFTMGYPYFVVACGQRIAISTDVGVLVVNVPYLMQISILHDD